MIKPISQVSFERFLELLSAYATDFPPRKLTAVHLHHTWRPTQAQWRGEKTMHAMRNHHVKERGFSDIAQHLTIDPAGGLWTGRDFSLPPASSRGQNGDRTSGPFMIEIVGDFDVGRDVLLGSQLETVKKVTAAVLKAAGLDATHVNIVPHSRFRTKTCPGSSLSTGENVQEWLYLAIKGWLEKYPPEIPAFSPESRIDRARGSRGGMDESISSTNWDLFEVPEDDDTCRALVGSLSQASSTTTRGDRPTLGRNVVNVERGQFSSDGRFTQDETRFNAIFDIHIPAFFTAREGKPKRIMIHAHGGLNSESAALDYAGQHLGWWESHDIYPIYIVWETGFFEILADYLGLDPEKGARGRVREWTDRRVEQLARGPLRFEWNEMKAAAWEASASALENGAPGVLRLMARKLVPKVLSGEWEVHLVGHSAGSVVHAHLAQAFLETREQLKTSSGDAGKETHLIKSVALLAPAASVDVFKSGFCQLEATTLRLRDDIARLDVYTMDEPRELADSVGWKFIDAYGKSLLYLVSRGFDSTPAGSGPIVGLQESIRKDSQLDDRVSSGLFHDGSDQQPLTARENAKASLFLSSDRAPHPRRTDSSTHGGFDNDPNTMHSILARIQGKFPEGHPPSPGLPFPGDSPKSSAKVRVQRRRRVLRLSAPESAATPAIASRNIARRALCVGINSYPDMPLAGCVHDVYRWERALSDLGFQVDTLLEQQATLSNIQRALQTLIAEARAGDIIVFQYSGHGTWLPDLNGDEDDGKDEALVPIDHLESGYLLDDDIAALASQVAPGVRMTLFMDCCHSGSNSRARPARPPVSRDGKSRPRYLPATMKMRSVHALSRQGQPSSSPLATKGALPWVQLSACQDHEFAYETEGAGDFTSAALETLAVAVRAGQQPREFVEQVGKRLQVMGQRQNPLLLDTYAPHLEDGLLSAGSERASPQAHSGPGLNASDAELLQQMEALARQLRARLGQ